MSLILPGDLVQVLIRSRRQGDDQESRMVSGRSSGIPSWSSMPAVWSGRNIWYASASGSTAAESWRTASPTPLSLSSRIPAGLFPSRNIFRGRNSSSSGRGPDPASPASERSIPSMIQATCRSCCSRPPQATHIPKAHHHRERVCVDATLLGLAAPQYRYPAGLPGSPGFDRRLGSCLSRRHR